MKKLATFVLILAAFQISAMSQEAVFVLPDSEDVEFVDEVPVQRPVGFTGIVSQIFKVFQPLQLINPFAPKSYGSGEQNLSRDKDWSATYFDSTELTVAGVEW